MFVDYNYSNFPIVNVNINETTINDTEFENFKAGWMHCFTYQRPWTFIFNAQNIGTISMKYIIKIATFIQKLKKNPDYNNKLERSIIITSSKTVDMLLKIVFNLTRPQAPVFILYDNSPDYISSILSKIKNNEPLPRNIKTYHP